MHREHAFLDSARVSEQTLFSVYGVSSRRWVFTTNFAFGDQGWPARPDSIITYLVHLCLYSVICEL